MASNRIVYFDVMKAFAIMSVVVNHIILWGMNGFYSINHTFWMKTIETQMPIFFFVSGYMFFKEGKEYSFSNSITFFRGKLFPLIVSAFVFMNVYNFIMGIAMSNCIESTYKSGYWFTLVLFVYYILGYLSMIMLNSVRGKVIITFGMSLLLSAAIYLLQFRCLSERMIGVLSVEQFYYYPVFTLGMLIHRYRRLFEDLQQNRHYQWILVVLFFMLNLIHLMGLSIFHTHHGITNLILQITNCVALLFFFSQLQDFFNKKKYSQYHINIHWYLHS